MKKQSTKCKQNVRGKKKQRQNGPSRPTVGPMLNSKFQVKRHKVPAFTCAQAKTFNEQFEAHYGRALRTARQWGAFDAEITVSKALTKAMLRFKPERGNFNCFFSMILRCELAMDYRNRIRRQTEPFPALFDLPDERIDRQRSNTELREIIKLAVGRLSKKDQLLFHLFYEKKLTIKQIAARGI